MGIFPLLSGWYASNYVSCDTVINRIVGGYPVPFYIPNHFEGGFNLLTLPNGESIPIKHSLQEIEFISSANFLSYLKLRPYVAAVFPGRHCLHRFFMLF
jgi:hypothetical protein